MQNIPWLRRWSLAYSNQLGSAPIYSEIEEVCRSIGINRDPYAALYIVRELGKAYFLSTGVAARTIGGTTAFLRSGKVTVPDIQLLFVVAPLTASSYLPRISSPPMMTERHCGPASTCCAKLAGTHRSHPLPRPRLHSASRGQLGCRHRCAYSRHRNRSS